MVETDKTFAETYGLNKPTPLKIEKNTLNPAAKQIVPTILSLRTYKSTAKNMKQLKLLEQLLATTLKKSVGQSAVLRSLIHLAATDNGVREKLLVLIPLENIHGGRPRK